MFLKGCKASTESQRQAGLPERLCWCLNRSAPEARLCTNLHLCAVLTACKQLVMHCAPQPCMLQTLRAHTAKLKNADGSISRLWHDVGCGMTRTQNSSQHCLGKYCARSPYQNIVQLPTVQCTSSTMHICTVAVTTALDLPINAHQGQQNAANARLASTSSLLPVFSLSAEVHCTDLPLPLCSKCSEHTKPLDAGVTASHIHWLGQMSLSAAAIAPGSGPRR
jgi:hypothetical protein